MFRVGVHWIFVSVPKRFHFGFRGDNLAIVEMLSISKRFGLIQANQDIDLAIEKGEIHCILGENGAGKSTLVKILFGLYKADRGSIWFLGKEVKLKGPQDAIRLGIGMIHQHFMLVPRLTVTENIIAGKEIRKGRFLDYETAHKRVETLAKGYGFRVNPRSKVEDISVGEQQRVEILKALYRDAEVLILDEPTAVLTPQETQELFLVLGKLKKEGKTVILITHKLKETMEIADRITILRDGKKIATVLKEETSLQDLADKMVGRKVLLRVDKRETNPGEEVLRVENLSFYRGKKPVLNDVNLLCRSGEILGIAGVEGNGQVELEEAIMGLISKTQGQITVLSTPLEGMSTLERKNMGIAHIPSDRLKRGIIPDLSVEKNAILGLSSSPSFSWYGFLRKAAIYRYTLELIATYHIRGAFLHSKAKDLSGGNQQKLVIGRELARKPRLILAAQPTRGVDVGAIEYIHQELLRQKEAGCAIVLISAELDEIRSLSDQVAVLYEGSVVAFGPTKDFTEGQLGLLMAGQSLEGAYHE